MITLIHLMPLLQCRFAAMKTGSHEVYRRQLLPYRSCLQRLHRPNSFRKYTTQVLRDSNHWTALQIFLIFCSKHSLWSGKKVFQKASVASAPYFADTCDFLTFFLWVIVSFVAKNLFILFKLWSVQHFRRRDRPFFVFFSKKIKKIKIFP